MFQLKIKISRFSLALATCRKQASRLAIYFLAIIAAAATGWMTDIGDFTRLMLAAGGVFLVWRLAKKLWLEYLAISTAKTILATEKYSGISAGTLQMLADKPLLSGISAPDKWFTRLRLARGEALKIKPIKPNFMRVFGADNYALIPLALIIIILSCVIDTDRATSNIRSLFRLPEVTTSNSSTKAISATIKYPDYIGGEITNVFDGKNPTPLKIPEGSIINVEVKGYSSAPRLLTNGRNHKLGAIDGGGFSGSAEINSGKIIALKSPLGGSISNRKIELIKDTPPRPEFTSEITLSSNKRIKFDFKIAEEYGLNSLKLEGAIQPATGEAIYSKTVDIPVKAVKDGFIIGSASIKIPSIRWYGNEITLKLKATDKKSQQGESESQLLKIPEITFKNQFAAKVNWQRILLEKPNDGMKPEPLIASHNIDLLSNIIGEYNANLRVFMGLRSAAYRLAYMRESDSDYHSNLKSAINLLADTAYYIEGGNSPESDYDSAINQLLNAMRSGDSLKNLAILARELSKQAEQHLNNINITHVDEKDLPPELMQQIGSVDDIISQAFRLYAIGEKDKAMQLLEKLRSELEKAENEPTNPIEEAAMRDAIKAMHDLKEVAAKQKELADNAYENKNNTSQMQSLEEKQRDLLKQAEQISQQIQKSSSGTCSKLESAKNSMREGANSLASKEGEQAAKHGMQAYKNIMESLQNKQREFTQRFGKQFIMNGMGRNSGASGEQVYDNKMQIPEQNDMQKSREILEELYRRSRSHNPNKNEKDYLERLLNGL